MEKDKAFNIDEMKRIAHEIIDEEVKKHNIKLKVFPVTFVEYYKDYVSRRNYKLVDKASMVFRTIKSGGFNDHKGML